VHLVDHKRVEPTERAGQAAKVLVMVEGVAAAAQ
jgi:hypothetical protein